MKIGDGPAAVTGDEGSNKPLSCTMGDGKALFSVDPEVRRPA